MRKFGNCKDAVAELLIKILKDINKKNLAERIEYFMSSQDGLAKSDMEEPLLGQKVTRDEQLLKPVGGQGYTDTASSHALFELGNTQSKSRSPVHPSVTLKKILTVRVPADSIAPRVYEMLYLRSGLILLADGFNFCLKVFDSEGNLLHKWGHYHYCFYAAVADERVACYNGSKKTLQILHVSSSFIKIESECKIHKWYRRLTSLDSHIIAAMDAKEIDIISLSGQILRSFVTSESVSRACRSKDGFLVCIYPCGILKIDPINGAEIHKLRMPKWDPIPCDVATTKDNFIIVLTNKNIDLYDAQCIRLKRLESRYGLYFFRRLSIIDDVMVCCTDKKLYILELTYQTCLE